MLHVSDGSNALVDGPLCGPSTSGMAEMRCDFR